MRAEDVVTIIEEFAKKSEADADAANLDGSRILAMKVYLQRADQEALKHRDDLLLASMLWFVAERIGAAIARARAREEAVTPVEPTVISFVDGE